MSANTFGSRFKMTSFGESHGTALGVVVDGCPAQIKWDQNLLLTELGRRRPGQTSASGSVVVTARNETDQPEILSGVWNDQTLGTPIAMIVRNQDARSDDYLKAKPTGSSGVRQGHADDVWLKKFGISDPRGGGRSSGRETVARVLAGSVAQMLVNAISPMTNVIGFAAEIGPIKLDANDRSLFSESSKLEKYKQDKFTARFPSTRHQQVEKLLLDAKSGGESYGGVAEIWIDHPPVSLGQPVFHKLKNDFANAFFSVGAVNGVQLGEEAMNLPGTKFHSSENQEAYGGIRGGISTGERIVFQVAFKPTASILDTAKLGRHDPCIVPRAIPVLESMAWLVLADHILWARQDRP